MQVKGESIQDQEATVEGVEPSCDEVAELGACGVRPEGAHRLRFICMRQQNLRHQRNFPKMELFEPGPSRIHNRQILRSKKLRKELRKKLRNKRRKKLRDNLRHKLLRKNLRTELRKKLWSKLRGSALNWMLGPG